VIERPRGARSTRARSVRGARREVGNPGNVGDVARPRFDGAYGKVVDVPSEDVMVTGPTIAADRDDQWLGVTRSLFTRNGLITDATRTIPEQHPRNFSTTFVAQRVSECVTRTSAFARSVAGHVQ
jgi:hypothetical protein